MTNPTDLLSSSKTILLVDWPSREVPESLTRAGHRVVVRGGPEPDHYNEYSTTDDGIDTRFVGQPPVQVDVVYSYRPIDEMEEITDQALSLGARAVWVQLADADSADADRARSIVESAGLEYIDAPILDALARAPN